MHTVCYLFRTKAGRDKAHIHSWLTSARINNGQIHKKNNDYWGNSGVILWRSGFSILTLLFPFVWTLWMYYLFKKLDTFFTKESFPSVIFFLLFNPLIPRAHVYTQRNKPRVSLLIGKHLQVRNLSVVSEHWHQPSSYFWELRGLTDTLNSGMSS